MVNLDTGKMEKIVDDIYHNRCILFLGPSVKSVKKQKERFSSQDIYSGHLKELLEKENITFSEDSKDSYYYYVQKYMSRNGPVKTRTMFAEFDKNKYQPSSIYRLLAKLPFNTIVNVGSDTLMTDTISNENYTHKFYYYDHSKPAVTFLKDLPDKTQLVYNLLGSDKDYDSRILTEATRLKFMHDIASNKPLPANVLSRFDISGSASKSFIFLGFDFEEWPFRFLLHVLNIPKNELSFSAKSAASNIAVFTEEFYNDKFGMEFISDTNESFAGKLIVEYRKKYGVAISQKKAFISFHPDDMKFVDGFKKYLKAPKLEKLIKFSTRDEIFGEVKGKVFQETALSQYNIYIPFISIEFLNDDNFLSELQYVLANRKIRVFPIMSGACDAEAYIENFKSQVRHIFPEENEDDDEMYLGAISGDLGEVYNSIINTIKSAIR